MGNARLNGEHRVQHGGARHTLRRVRAPLALFVFALFILWGPVPWPCPMRVVFGIPCPTCGMTRAARLALAFDFAGATRMHPLWSVVLSVGVLVAIAEVVGYWRTERWGTVLHARRFGVVAIPLIVLIVAVWLLRFAGFLGGPAPI